ncbi:MAG: hypothetical protein WC304_03505 [Candidatus Gracilibacteria bacterium]
MENEISNLAVECISNSSNSWVDIFQALLTPAIAIFAAYIGWQQHKINKNRFKFEMYERRLKVFNAFVSFFKEVLNSNKINHSKLNEFYALTSEVEFIFGKGSEKLVSYREEIWNKGFDIHILQMKANASEKRREIDESIKIDDEIYKKIEWLIKQLTQKEVNKIFKEYLTI